MKLIPFESNKKMPWKNGQGITYEILKLNNPIESLNFNLRISIAQISKDNVFSEYTGYKRLLTVLSGTGIKFNSSEILNGEIKFFTGEEFVNSGPVKNEVVFDLGVIYKDEHYEVKMKKNNLAQITGESDYEFIFPLIPLVVNNQLVKVLDTVLITPSEKLIISSNEISYIHLKIKPIDAY